MNTKKILKQTAKKAYKTGYFNSFILKNNYLSFKDSFNNLYTLNSPDNIGFWFRIGKPFFYTEFKPTFESEYNLMGNVDMCKFIDKIEPIHTDNPNYILRISKAYLNN